MTVEELDDEVSVKTRSRVNELIASDQCWMFCESELFIRQLSSQYRDKCVELLAELGNRRCL